MQNDSTTHPLNIIVKRFEKQRLAERADMPTITTCDHTGVRALTRAAIDKLEAKHGHKKSFRRLPVANFLLSINTNMQSGHCFANCDMDARAYNWKSPIVTAIHHGINHLFYGKKL